MLKINNVENQNLWDFLNLNKNGKVIKMENCHGM